MMTRDTPPVRIAVMGAGLIGRRHVEHILAEPDASLHAVVDPSPAARDFAAARGLPWHPDFAALMRTGRPDGVLIATPNQLHREHALAAIAAGLPTLVEKPLADSIEAAQEIVTAAERAGVALATGHHRRHNPLIRRAKAMIDEGRLGRIVTVHSFFWLMKPDDYFDVPWRRQKGAGPVLMNLSHDIDLMRHLCGEIDAVQAFQSNMVRGHVIDETTALSLRFANGALGTMNVSDTVVAPWSWEHTTGENPVYPPTDQPCYFIAGTHGSLAIPRLELWRNADRRGWWEPFSVVREIAANDDPLRLQVRQFCKVIRGEEAPLVSGREGLMTLKVIQAVQRAAESGEKVSLS
jgi:predicted dehydrogenase